MGLFKQRVCGREGDGSLTVGLNKYMYISPRGYEDAPHTTRS